MAIDMSKMQAKLDKLNNKGGGETSIFWRPDEGDQTIRIMCPEDGDPFKDFHFHYNVGNNRGFLCTKKNFGEDCPVCDFASKLWREGVASNDDELKKQAKSLFTRQRFASPVLVRGEEDKGVKVWSYGKRAYETLIGYVLNPEYGDITDVDEGTDITLTYTLPKTPGAYPQTTLTPRRRTSPLCDDAVGDGARCNELLESIPDFENLYERKSPSQIQAMLDEYLSDDTDAEMNSSESQKYGSTNSVDAAFARLTSGGKNYPEADLPF